ncbi:MAG TPA: hypothetical protein VE422_15185 [Terriglobia bacterium]|nr:hypothetical protein [Terriglobia bacterium]
MRVRSLAIHLIGFVLICSSAAYADPFTFDTLPASGDVAGPAGSTAGWGYSVTNTSLTDWLVLTSVTAGAFLNGTPASLFDFPIVAPGTTATVAFDVLAGFGLYQLTWDPTAPAGFVNSGTFVLSAEWWNGDPGTNGSFLTLADDQSAPYTATVTAPVTALPAPSTLLLMAGGLAAMSLTGTNRRRVASNRSPRQLT